MTEIKPWKQRIENTTLMGPLATYQAMEAEIAELRAALAKVEQGEPVARVTGYHAGRCVIEPLDRATVFPAGMAVYTHPVRPMSDEQIEDAFSRLPNAKSGQFYYYLGIADAEAFHGIKGATE